MPIGAPSYRPEPKSACTLPELPIERTIAPEFFTSGSLSTRWFHGLFFGNTAHFAAPVTGWPEAIPAVTEMISTSNAIAIRPMEAFCRTPSARIRQDGRLAADDPNPGVRELGLHPRGGCDSRVGSRARAAPGDEHGRRW